MKRTLKMRQKPSVIVKPNSGMPSEPLGHMNILTKKSNTGKLPPMTARIATHRSRKERRLHHSMARVARLAAWLWAS